MGFRGFRRKLEILEFGSSRDLVLPPVRIRNRPRALKELVQKDVVATIAFVTQRHDPAGCFEGNTLGFGVPYFNTFFLL